MQIITPARPVVNGPQPNHGDEAILRVVRSSSLHECVVIGNDTVDGSYDRSGLPWWANLEGRPHPGRIVNISWSSARTARAIQFIKKLAAGGTKIFCRDWGSWSRLMWDCNIDAPVAPDLVFVTQPLPRVEASLLVLVPRGGVDLMPLVSAVKNICAPKLVLSHDMRQSSGDNTAAIRLAKLLDAEILISVELDEVLEIYRRAAMVMAMRMHACLLAMLHGVPAVMLSDYRQKARGQFAHFGLEHLVFTDYFKQSAALPGIWEQRHDVSEHIASRLPKIQKQAKLHITDSV